jgi:anti-sigma factor RsiW
MTSNGIDDWALHAYVDNEMSPEQRAEFEKILQGDPERAKKAESFRRQRELLKQAYDSALDEPLPASLTATIRTGGRVTVRPYIAMAAAVALVMLGGFGGWFAAQDRGQIQVADIAREAITAHEVYAVEVRHPVEVAAAEKEHLQAWLSKRIGTPFKVPDLTADGYTLVGGRLLAAIDGPAAQLMYEDAAKNRVTIFLIAQQSESETAVHVEEKGKLIACYWRDGKLAFAVAGEMELDPMMKLARSVYDQFES